MKFSLIFLLVALYGVAAQDYTSSEEEAAYAEHNANVYASAGGSSDLGATVKDVMNHMADMSHSFVVNGSAEIKTNLDSLLNVGTGLVNDVVRIQKDIVNNLTSSAQGWTNKGIERLTEIQAHLQSSPFGAIISPMLAMKMQALKLANQGIGMAGQVETAKGQLMADVVKGATGAAKGFAGVAANAATSGSGVANNLAKQMSGRIGAGIGALTTLGSGIGSRLASGFSNSMSTSTSNLSGRLSASTDGLSERLSASTDGLSGSLSASTDGLSGRLSAVTDGLSGRLSASTDRLSRRPSASTDGLSGRLSAVTDGLSGRLSASTDRLSRRLSASTDGLSGRLSASKERLLSGRLSASFEGLSGRMSASKEGLSGLRPISSDSEKLSETFAALRG